MPVNAPPTANADAMTADLYFELASQVLKKGELLRPGQRLSATLALRGTAESLVVPWSAVLHDASGGTWVYENIAPQVYTRRRVEVTSLIKSLAVLSRGPAIGAKIVAAGAAELFGTEFGAGK